MHKQKPNFPQPATAEHYSLPWEARPVPGMRMVAIAREGMMYPHAFVHVPGEKRDPLDRETLATALFISAACNNFYRMQAVLSDVADRVDDAGGAPAFPDDLMASVREALQAADEGMPSAIAAALRAAQDPPAGSR